MPTFFVMKNKKSIYAVFTFGFCIAFFTCFFGIHREISLFFYGKT